MKIHYVNYESPEVEVVAVEVEAGFAVSDVIQTGQVQDWIDGGMW